MLASRTDYGVLTVRNNAKLGALSLPNAKLVTSLMVTQNAALAQLSMPSLTQIAQRSPTSFVRANPSLPTCHAEALRTKTGLTNAEFDIQGNGTGACP